MRSHYLARRCRTRFAEPCPHFREVEEMSAREESDSVRWQIVLRTTLLFGEERAIANRDEIETVASAIHRLKRLNATSFDALKPEPQE